MASRKPDSETDSTSEAGDNGTDVATQANILGLIQREFGTGSRDDWAALTAAGLGKRGTTKNGQPLSTDAVFERLRRITPEGCTLDAVYTAHPASIEAAGQFPFRRGAVRDQASVSSAPWRIAVATSLLPVATANPLLLDDLHNGATALHLRCHDVGASLAADSLQVALQDVYLDAIRVDLDAGAQWPIVSGAITRLITANQSSLDLSALAINLNADPLGSLIQNTETAQPADATDAPLAELARLAPDWLQRYPGCGFCCADSRSVHERGADVALELGYLIASAKSYLEALQSAGISIDDAAAAIRFRVAIDQDYFAGIAKLRALRILWANVTSQYQVTTAKQCAAISAHTSTRMLSRLDTGNNLLRTTIACAAAALGDADSVTLEPYIIDADSDAAQVRRSTRNVALVLEHESGLRRVQDPLGGSGFIESLTEQYAAAGWQLFQDMENRGGIVAAMREGWLASLLQQQLQQRRQRIATRTLPITGVSEFAAVDEVMSPLSGVDTVVGNSAAYGPTARDSEGFEQLRDSAASLSTQASVFVVLVGDPGECRARYDFVSNLFAAGGIAVVADPDDTTAAAQQQAAKANAAAVVVVCGSDAAYAADTDSLAAMMMAIKSAGATRVLLAGKLPADSSLTAGVDECLYVGCDAMGILARTLAELSPDKTSLQSILSHWQAGESL